MPSMASLMSLIGVVDDRVEADFDLLLLGQLARRGRRAYLEADDDGVRSGGQQHVRLRDLSHGGVDDVDLHGLLRELDERARHGLDRAVHIALDDDVELLERSDAPSASARKLAEKEEIEIRLYSIIYDAINDIKDAIEGMLEPVMKPHRP